MIRMVWRSERRGISGSPRLLRRFGTRDSGPGTRIQACGSTPGAGAAAFAPPDRTDRWRSSAMHHLPDSSLLITATGFAILQTTPPPSTQSERNPWSMRVRSLQRYSKEWKSRCAESGNSIHTAPRAERSRSADTRPSPGSWTTATPRARGNARRSCRFPRVPSPGSRVPHQLCEAFEQVRHVMRPRAGLGMSLETERRAVGERKALQRTVEQRDVGHAGVGGQRRGIDRETVVLRGDQYPAVVEILHRVVGAVVAEFHLDGLRTQRDAHQLVAETDAEQGNLCIEEFARRGDRVTACGRIARAVGQE